VDLVAFFLLRWLSASLEGELKNAVLFLRFAGCGVRGHASHSPCRFCSTFNDLQEGGEGGEGLLLIAFLGVF
jgi:hypothetical protein